MTIAARIRDRFATAAEIDGTTLVASALRADLRLYFDEPLDEHADVVLPVFDELWTWLGRERFGWWRNSRMPLFDPLRQRTHLALHQMLTRGHPRDLGLFQAKGGAPNTGSGARDSVAEVSIAMRWYTRAGTYFGDAAGELRALDRYERLLEQPEAWRDRVLAVCELLPVKSGVAGLVAEHEGVQGATMARLYGAAMQHVGVDLDNRWNSSLAAPNAIKGVNWITVVGRDGVAQLGGLDALRAVLDASVTIHEAKHAVVLQAGPRPAAGDVNRGDDLPSYRSVYAAVRGLHQPMIEAASAFQMGRSDDRDRTETWLRRFDAPRSP